MRKGCYTDLSALIGYRKLACDGRELESIVSVASWSFFAGSDPHTQFPLLYYVRTLSTCS